VQRHPHPPRPGSTVTLRPELDPAHLKRHRHAAGGHRREPARILERERTVLDVAVAVPPLGAPGAVDERIGTEEPPDRRVVHPSVHVHQHHVVELLVAGVAAARRIGDRLPLRRAGCALPVRAASSTPRVEARSKSPLGPRSSKPKLASSLGTSRAPIDGSRHDHQHPGDADPEGHHAPANAEYRNRRTTIHT
jgi:hypothetical protein